MTLRDLSDLELAALGGALFELTFLAGALETCPEAFAAAGRAVVAEILARRSEKGCTDRLFSTRYPVPVQCLTDFLRLARQGAAMLEQKGFPAAAELLFARASSELPVNTIPQSAHLGGIELRSLQ